MKRPGLTADRAARAVTITARSTGLLPSGNPPEFLLVAPNSGHAYESVAISDAKAGDLRDALVFIGMPEGRAYDPARLRFWPKGERVRISFRWKGADGAEKEANASRLLHDNRINGPIPDSGWVFVGSPAAAGEGTGSLAVCAADVREPNSIISTYNEQATVLDVPRKAPQGLEYGHILMNPEHLIPTNVTIEVRITPEHTNGFRRVVDLAMGIKPGTEKGAPPVFDVSGGPVSLKGAPLNEALKAFSELNDAGKDPFVAISFDAALSLGQARDVCGVINAIETEKGIRVEPPPDGQLFCRAFLPDEKNRDRKQRLAQPWELRFKRAGGRLETTLVQIKESWPEEGITPDLTVEEAPVQSPEVLKREIGARGPGLPVILVFGPADLTYGEMMRFLRPLFPDYRTVFVFVE